MLVYRNIILSSAEYGSGSVCGYNEASIFQGVVMPGLTRHLSYNILLFKEKTPGQAWCDRTPNDLAIKLTHYPEYLHLEDTGNFPYICNGNR